MKLAILCLAVLLAAVSLVLHAQTASPLYPNGPSEIPPSVGTTQEGADYTRREVMIPMHDGVKLYTVLLIPSRAHNAGIVLTSTSYSASSLSPSPALLKTNSFS